MEDEYDESEETINEEAGVSLDTLLRLSSLPWSSKCVVVVTGALDLLLNGRRMRLEIVETLRVS